MEKDQRENARISDRSCLSLPQGLSIRLEQAHEAGELLTYPVGTNQPFGDAVTEVMKQQVPERRGTGPKSCPHEQCADAALSALSVDANVDGGGPCGDEQPSAGRANLCRAVGMTYHPVFPPSRRCRERQLHSRPHGRLQRLVPADRYFQRGASVAPFQLTASSGGGGVVGYGLDGSFRRRPEGRQVAVPASGSGRSGRRSRCRRVPGRNGRTPAMAVVEAGAGRR